MKLSEERYDNPAYRDIKNSIDTAKEEGREEGREEGMNQRSLEIARNMLAKGMDASTVLEITGLSMEEIQQLIARGEPSGRR